MPSAPRKADNLTCIAFVIVAVFLLSATAPASEPPSSAIDAAVRLQLPAHPHSGFSVAVVHAGRIVYSKGSGYRDDGTPDRFIPKDRNYYGMPFTRGSAMKAAADPRTIYEIGSLTKQFTAAAVLLLVERHRLSLDDAVVRYAPIFRDPQLTIRMLLTQRSGLPDLNSLDFLQRVRPSAMQPNHMLDANRVSHELAALPLNFIPGTRFEYSNSNYFVLGTIVERIAGQPLAAYLQSNIFAPLGMTRTAYAMTAAADDVALGYRADEGGTVRRAYPWDLAWLGGAGAMTSTVQDMAHWNSALLAHHVLGASSLAQMWHGLDAGRGQGSYAMGWIEDALGSHRYLWHNGEVGGFHSLNVIFPNDDLAFTILSNNQDAKPEYLVPGLASLYFPVTGLDRILPRSGVVLIQASLAVAIGALAIAVVAIATLRRFMIAGICGAVLALLAGFLLPTIVGYILAGLIALIPTAAYVAAVRFIPRKLLRT